MQAGYNTRRRQNKYFCNFAILTEFFFSIINVQFNFFESELLLNFDVNFSSGSSPSFRIKCPLSIIYHLSNKQNLSSFCNQARIQDYSEREGEGGR